MAAAYIQYKVVTVTNDDTSINAEITTQQAAGWMYYTMILSGTNVILTFYQAPTT